MTFPTYREFDLWLSIHPDLKKIPIKEKPSWNWVELAYSLIYDYFAKAHQEEHDNDAIIMKSQQVELERLKDRIEELSSKESSQRIIIEKALEFALPSSYEERTPDWCDKLIKILDPKRKVKIRRLDSPITGADGILEGQEPFVDTKASPKEPLSDEKGSRKTEGKA